MKVASNPDILWEGIQIKMWKNTFPKIGESPSAKFLLCLELHVDQLRALWKTTWINMTVAHFMTCLLIKEQQNNHFNMHQDHQHRLERKPENLLKTVTGNVMTKQPKCHHSWSTTVGSTCWVPNKALHKLFQTAVLSLDCLYKLSGIPHWREQQSLAAKCCSCFCYIFSPEAIWSLCICFSTPRRSQQCILHLQAEVRKYQLHE